jgi:diaminopimelate decarboxylase
VFVSGLFSGPNPSPGLGTARSLRLGYPAIRLVGVDYSTRSTGLHSPVFDDLWIQRPWAELDLDVYSTAVTEQLADGAVWVSGLDLESRWLADTVGEHPRLLSPPAAALNHVAKPAVAVARDLGLMVPPSVSALESDWELHRFCREHGWRIWLKGPHYQAIAVNSWRDFHRARAHLAETWRTEELHLQAHVSGIEESVVFAAWRQGVVGTAHMAKRIVTDEGKTWAGRISSADAVVPGIAARLGTVMREIGWRGGGEVEMLRDSSGDLYLLEINPRFPAWIYGSTLAGLNLPAALVEAATGAEPVVTRESAPEFVRVVVEIPVRTSHPLPTPTIGWDGGTGPGKHPSGMPELAGRLSSDITDRRPPPGLSKTSALEIDALVQRVRRTPAPLLLIESTRIAWREIADRVAAATSQDGPRIQVAYSVKTNPDRRLLDLARACGFLAEAISSDERALAESCGFAADSIVLNGPAKLWPSRSGRVDVLAAFADSVSEMGALVDKRVRARYMGPRLRLPTVRSRFGVRIDDPAAYGAFVRALADLPSESRLGIHFHYAASDLGWSKWRDAAESIVRWAATIQRAVGRPVQCLDLGGGWQPEDWAGVLLPRLADVVTAAVEELPHLDTVLLEPGKALAQPACVVATQVLEVRQPGEAVVDASIAELPDAGSHPHRVLHRDPHSGFWVPLAAGDARILGRLCMEGDVLAAGVALTSVRRGDLLVIADAGAYDRSMEYRFGRG